MWPDKWLPRSSTFKVILPLPPYLTHLKVCDSINFEVGGWHDSFMGTFLDLNGELTMGLPVCFACPRDKLARHFLPNGAFCVCYAILFFVIKLLMVKELQGGQQNLENYLASECWSLDLALWVESL